MDLTTASIRDISKINSCQREIIKTNSTKYSELSWMIIILMNILEII